jgi:hypothetical protein
MKTIKIFGIRYTYVPDKTYLKWLKLPWTLKN